VILHVLCELVEVRLYADNVEPMRAGATPAGVPSDERREAG
jgi:hypothetical protein